MRPQRWATPAANTLLLQAWETESAVYDRRNGETHLLSALPAELLRRLMNTNHSADELAEQVAMDLQLAADARLRQNVYTSLLQLEALGLASLTDS